MNILKLKTYFDKYQAAVTKQVSLEKEVKEMQQSLQQSLQDIADIKQLMLAEVKSAGETKVKLGAVSFIVSAGKDSLKVENVAALPGRYTMIKTTANTAAIRAALMNGAEIPGAYLVTGPEYLTIR